MVKSIIKESLIMILLCVAIVLILGVIFYDYIPTNKAVPNPMTPYTTPADIQNEIDEEIIEAEQKNITYTITGSDLKLYKQTNSYVAGKANPFAASTEVDPNVNTNSEGTTGGSSSSNGNNSTGTFFNNTGLK